MIGDFLENLIVYPLSKIVYFFSGLGNFLGDNFSELFAIIFGIIFFVVIPAFIIFGLYLIKAIALYNLAFKAGYDKPWIAFIPIFNDYLSAILPMDEFSFLGMYKTYDRGKAFWLFLIVLNIAPIIVRIAVSIIGSIINVFISMILVLIPGGSLVSVGISLVIGFVGTVILNIALSAKYIFKAIIRVDLIGLYLKKNLAYTLGILSIFIGGMFPIVLLCLIKKEPKFGFGKYYTPLFIQEDEE